MKYITPRNFALWFVVLAALMLMALVFFTYSYWQRVKQENFSNTLDGGFAALVNGDLQGSIVKFESAANVAPGADEQAYARSNLGFALLRDDPIRGLSILKDVSLDESLSGMARAQAINGVLAYFYFIYGDLPTSVLIAQNNIFIGKQWESFAQGGINNRNDLKIAIRKAFEWSSGLYQNYSAEYAIASWYGDQLKHKKASISAEKIQQYVSIIKDHVARGDASLEFMRIADPRFREAAMAYTIAFWYIHRGLALEGLVKAGEAMPQQVEDNYTYSLNLFGADRHASSFVEASAFFSRFHFARFIANLSPNQESKQDREKIADLLAPVYESGNRDFWDFFRFASDAGAFDEDPFRNDISRLAKIDSRFRSKLIALGWKESEFK